MYVLYFIIWISFGLFVERNFDDSAGFQDCMCLYVFLWLWYFFVTLGQHKTRTKRQHTICVTATYHLPLKIGHTTHAFMQLVPRNCPRETSKRNNGIPQVTRQTTNGMRKAPVKDECIMMYEYVHYLMFAPYFIIVL